MKKDLHQLNRTPIRLKQLFCFILLSYAVNHWQRIIAQQKGKGTMVTCPAHFVDVHTKHGIPDQSDLALKTKKTKVPTAQFIITFGEGAEANPSAKAAFQYALDIWSKEIVSSAPIRVYADFANLGTGTLASAGPVYTISDFDGAPEPNILYPAALANSIAGKILFPEESYELTVRLGNGIDFYFGTDGNTPAGKFDFVSVALHEIGHGLGFTTRRSYNGTTGIGSLKDSNSRPSVYSKFIVDGEGNNLLDYEDPSIALGTAMVSNDIFVDAPFAVAALGGKRPQIYAPTSWRSGSSIAHWDEAAYPAGDPNSLMSPQFSRAESNFDIGAITRGYFKDMGWTLNNTGAPLLVSKPSKFSEEISVNNTLKKAFTLTNITNEKVSVHVSSASNLISFLSKTSFDLDVTELFTFNFEIVPVGLKGFYQEKILVHIDGNPIPVIIPVDIRILDGTETPSIAVNVHQFDETISQLNFANKELIIDNLGDDDLSYSASITSTTVRTTNNATPLYTTGFEDFESGQLNGQMNWTSRDANTWTVSEENPFEGNKHLRAISDGLGANRTLDTRLGSPTVKSSGNKTFNVFKARINIQGSGVTWDIQPQAPSLRSRNTRIRFFPNGTIGANISGNNYDILPITIPSGYFEIKLSIDKDTSQYYLFIDNELVYVGTSFAPVFEEVIVLSAMEVTGSTLDIDNFELIDGDDHAPIITVAPTLGTIPFKSSKKLDIKFDARNLEIGSYTAFINITHNDPNTTTVVLPVNFTVVEPPVISVAPEALFAQINTATNTSALATAMLTITNPSTANLNFDTTIGLPSFETSSELQNANRTLLETLDLSKYGIGNSNTYKITEAPTPFDQTTSQNDSAEKLLTRRFTDSISYTSNNNMQSSHVGNRSATSITTAIRFETTSNFALSAIRNGFKTDFLENPIIILEIYKGGDTPAEGTLLATKALQQSSAFGKIAVEFLDKTLTFVAGESFWVVHKYPEGIQFPQGFDRDAVKRPNTHFISTNGGTSYNSLDNFPLFVRALGGAVTPYITLDGQNGELAPGASAQVAVTFDATQLDNGVYKTPLIIKNNDPLQPNLNIPTTLTVSGQVPQIELSDNLVQFESIFVGNKDQKIITITNTGKATLTLTDFSSTTEDFEIPTTNVNIPPGATYNLFVNFVPSTTGSINGLINLQSNIPNMPFITIIAYGVGVAPPIAVLESTTPIHLDKNELGTAMIELRNEGKSPLRYAFNNPPIAVVDSPVFIDAISPSSGVIAAGSTKKITLRVDATELQQGVYRNTLTVDSNSPDKSTSTVTIVLKVFPILEITHFDLINADTNEVIKKLTEGTVIDLANFKNNSFNIVAVPDELSAGSVIFDFNGISNYNIENVAPYAVAGDIAGDYKSLTLPYGTNTITANSYTGINGSGQQGAGLTINFEVIDSVTPYITSFNLINADTDTVIGPLTDGAIINTAELGTKNLNVIAVTGISPVGIVAFDLNGVKNFRTERVAPYTLAGDIGNDFKAIQFPEGANTLTAHPASVNIPRLFGTPFTVNFKVINTSSLTVKDIVPNPTNSITNFVLENSKDDEVEAYIMDLLGNIILPPSDFVINTHGHGSIDMGALQQGTYLLIIKNSFGETVQALVVKN